MGRWLGQAVRTLPPGWVIPDGYTFTGMGTCKGCRASMAWANTPAGKMSPLDRVGTSHFITCPKRQEFRRQRDV